MNGSSCAELKVLTVCYFPYCVAYYLCPNHRRESNLLLQSLIPFLTIKVQNLKSTLPHYHSKAVVSYKQK